MDILYDEWFSHKCKMLGQVKFQSIQYIQSNVISNMTSIIENIYTVLVYYCDHLKRVNINLNINLKFIVRTYKVLVFLH